MALNSWMGDLADTKQLNQLIMPGSHDSGMAWDSTNPTPGHLASKANACTQRLTVAGQLGAGARWFDVRLSEKKTSTPGSKGIRCFHDYAFGEPLSDVALSIVQFVVEHPTETVIVLLTKSEEAAYPAFLNQLALCASDFEPNFAPLAPYPNKQIAEMTLGSLRGRIVVAMDKPPAWKKANNMILRAKLNKWDGDKAFKTANYLAFDSIGDRATRARGDGTTHDYILNTAGSYSDKNNAASIKSGQVTRQGHINTAWAQDRLWMGVYYTTNTSPIGLRASSIELADREMWSDNNKAAWSQVAIRIKSGLHPLFNCVMMDFIDATRGQDIRDQAALIGC